jgi:hypothetical protein
VTPEDLSPGLDPGSRAKRGEGKDEGNEMGGHTRGLEPPPLPLRTVPVALAGTALWLVALVATLVVPSLHTGDRQWWPWTCVAGAALGLLGYAYLRRGRGNADGAR